MSDGLNMLGERKANPILHGKLDAKISRGRPARHWLGRCKGMDGADL